MTVEELINQLQEIVRHHPEMATAKVTLQLRSYDPEQECADVTTAPLIEVKKHTRHGYRLQLNCQ